MAPAFTKMHGLGNDFIVVDARERPFQPEPDRIAQLADRRLGIGFDQLLVLDTPAAGAAVAAYRVYNADGSPAGQCGNGVRCLARWLADRGQTPGPSFRLDGPAGPVALECLADGSVRVDMGAPALEPAAIPLRAERQRDRYRLDTGHGQVNFGAVSLGNPHAVIEVDCVADAPVRELGTLLQADARFPEGVNVGFMEVVDSARIRLRVFERGAGETRACGSGACAAVVCGILWGRLDVEASVELPGGALTIQWAGGDQPVWMTGPAVEVFEGRTDP